MTKTRRTVTLAVLISVAMILSYLESLIPVFIAVPGVKIGLANIASVFTLFLLGVPSAVAVSLIRVSLTALLFGNMMSLFYSISGAALSLLVMAAVKKITRFSPVGISVLGGVFHNIGQILVACLILESAALVLYLPVLLISGTLAGVVTGIAGGILIKRLDVVVKTNSKH